MSKWQGTPVPNTGHVENVYFNTNLSVDEVVSLLQSANLTYDVDGYYDVFEHDENNALFILNGGEGFYTILSIVEGNPSFIFSTQEYQDMGVDFVGWNAELQNFISFNLTNNLNGESGQGDKNQELSSLFSITPFVEVQEKVTLNSFLTDIADAIRSKKGTADKINASNFASEIESISGGGSGVIEVDELPTENIQENTLYKIKEATDIDVFIELGGGGFFSTFTLAEIISELGVTPNLSYFVVEELPNNPQVSDLLMFDPGYVYICNDIPYVFGDIGEGNMWIEVSMLISENMGEEFENKGYIYCGNQFSFNVQEKGVYVTYKKSYAINEEYYSNVYSYTEGWNNYKDIFYKTVTSFTDKNIKLINAHAFKQCYDLVYVDIPNAIYIDQYAFESCGSLKTIRLPKVKTINMGAFQSCSVLTDVYLGKNEVVGVSSNSFHLDENVKVHVRANLLSDYQSNTFWAELVSKGNVILVGDYTD